VSARSSEELVPPPKPCMPWDVYKVKFDPTQMKKNGHTVRKVKGKRMVVFPTDPDEPWSLRTAYADDLKHEECGGGERSTPTSNNMTRVTFTGKYGCIWCRVAPAVIRYAAVTTHLMLQPRLQNREYLAFPIYAPYTELPGSGPGRVSLFWVGAAISLPEEVIDDGQESPIDSQDDEPLRKFEELATEREERTERAATGKTLQELMAMSVGPPTNNAGKPRKAKAKAKVGLVTSAPHPRPVVFAHWLHH
jgi:hypothetical protein